MEEKLIKLRELANNSTLGFELTYCVSDFTWYGHIGKLITKNRSDIQDVLEEMIETFDENG